MSYKVLIVDDSKLARMAISKILTALRPDWTRIEAANPDEAVAFFAASEPNIALLDFNMPGRDGFEVLNALKSDEATQGIAVIMVTGQRSEGNIVAGLRQADDYVTKPFGMGELVARINAVMRRVSNNARSHHG